MTKEQAIKTLEHSIESWEEFWSGASSVVSDEDIEAIELLIDIAKKN